MQPPARRPAGRPRPFLVWRPDEDRQPRAAALHRRLQRRVVGHPQVMRIATQRGLHHETLMRFVLKLLANLTDERDGDAMDRIVNGLSRLAPTA